MIGIRNTFGHFVLFLHSRRLVREIYGTLEKLVTKDCEKIESDAHPLAASSLPTTLCRSECGVAEVCTLASAVKFFLNDSKIDTS